MSRKVRCPILSFVLLLAWSGSLSQEIPSLLDSVDDFLARSTKIPEDGSRQELLNDSLGLFIKLVDDEIARTHDRERLMNLNFAKSELQSRIKLIERIRAGLGGMPPDSLLIARCNNCLERIGEYLKTQAQRTHGQYNENTQRRFLKRLERCFGYFSQNPAYYDTAVGLFHGLVYSEKAARDSVATYAERNPTVIDSLLDKLSQLKKSDIETWHKIQNILLKYAQKKISLQEVLSFLEDIFKNNSPDEIRSVFEQLNQSLSEKQSANKNAELFAYSLPDSIDVKQFLSPLMRYIRKVEDETLLRQVFSRLHDLVDDADTDKNSEAKLALDQLFHGEVDEYVPRNILDNIINAASRLSDFERTAVVIDFKRYGESPHPQFRPYRKRIESTLKEVWDASLEAPDSLLTEPERTSANDIGKEVVALKKHSRDRQLLYIYTRFRVEGEQFFIHFRMVDGEDGILLGVYDSRLDTLEGLTAFTNALRSEIVDIKSRFTKSLSGYLQFERLLQTKSIELLSFDRFKAFQLFGAQMYVRRNENVKNSGWIFADGIFVNHPFITNAKSTTYIEFGETLVGLFKKRQSVLSLPVYFDKTPSSHGISITGRTFDEEADRLDVIFESSSTDTILTIELRFSDEEVLTSQEDRNEYMAKYVVESMQSLLGVSIVPNLPKSIPSANGLPSLLFAGTSQFIIAPQLEQKSIKSQKRLGWMFAGTEIAMLGAAFYFDRKAISELDNDSLIWRNRFLGGAIATGLASAITALVRIAQHNRKICSYETPVFENNR